MEEKISEISQKDIDKLLESGEPAGDFDNADKSSAKKRKEEKKRKNAINLVKDSARSQIYEIFEKDSAISEKFPDKKALLEHVIDGMLTEDFSAPSMLLDRILKKGKSYRITDEDIRCLNAYLLRDAYPGAFNKIADAIKPEVEEIVEKNKDAFSAVLGDKNLFKNIAVELIKLKNNIVPRTFNKIIEKQRNGEEYDLSEREKEILRSETLRFLDNEQWEKKKTEETQYSRPGAEITLGRIGNYDYKSKEGGYYDFNADNEEKGDENFLGKMTDGKIDPQGKLKEYLETGKMERGIHVYEKIFGLDRIEEIISIIKNVREKVLGIIEEYEKAENDKFKKYEKDAIINTAVVKLFKGLIGKTPQIDGDAARIKITPKETKSFLDMHKLLNK